ncbi:hypothetical protein CLBKND_03196 [Methylorubrum aminovorans]
MRIDRVQVEEGFLDGLDVRFRSGLNVIIGARGTGKTSLIELIRFCLGVPGFSSEFTRRSLDHARAVLAGGQIAVTLINDDGGEVVISRSASDPEPRATARYSSPLIFSQTEIENLGLAPESRLKLIDDFIKSPDLTSLEEARVGSLISSYTSEIAAERNEIEQLEKQLDQLPEIEKQLFELLPKERQIAQSSEELRAASNKLSVLSEKLSQLTVSIDEIERFKKSLATMRVAFEATSRIATFESTQKVDKTLIGKALEAVRRAASYQAKAFQEIQSAELISTEAQQWVTGQRVHLEDEARALRRDVDRLKEGSGTIARQGQQLRERRAQIASFQDLLDQRRLNYTRLISKRANALDDLDALRERRFRLRYEVAGLLTSNLAPNIKVQMERAGQTKLYAGMLIGMLRGSGIRYNDLAPTIASNVSPRELLEWIEEDNSDSLSVAIGVPRDRAMRILSTLRTVNIAELAVVSVEDDVRFYLLDGQDYKDFTKLSTGQRCTVVLPIILDQQNGPLIIDQPEDHIDNAFIAETLIKSIHNRPDQDQIIVSTHNANIPVLGDAAVVTHLGSDGRRGHVVVSAELQNPEAVKAITNVMEGGAKAFEQRAKFYKRHSSGGA